MACRCQERREVIRKAGAQKTASAVVDAAKFVVRTMAEDAVRSVDIRNPFKRRGNG